MYSKEMILREIKRIAEMLGQNFLKSKVFEEHSTVPLNTVRFYLGTWKEAVKEAGLNVRDSIEIIKTKDLLIELMRLYNEFGEPPTPDMLKKHGRYQETLYYKKWTNLSEAFASAKKKISEKDLNDYMAQLEEEKKKSRDEEKSLPPEDSSEEIKVNLDSSSNDVEEPVSDAPVQVDLYEQEIANPDQMEETLEQGSKLDLPDTGIKNGDEAEDEEKSAESKALDDEVLSKQIDEAYNDSKKESAVIEEMEESEDDKESEEMKEPEDDKESEDGFDNSATLEIEQRDIADQISEVNTKKSDKSSKKPAPKKDDDVVEEPDLAENVIDDVVMEKTDTKVVDEDKVPEPEIPEEKEPEDMSESDIDDIIESTVKKPKKRRIVGEPIDFRGLRYAPINKQGVIFLFAMVSRDLGYIVESMGPEFPDAEGKRCFDTENNQWEHVNIGFCYRSSDMSTQGIDENLCDVIVCWMNDWVDCPFEVLELRTSLGQIDS